MVERLCSLLVVRRVRRSRHWLNARCPNRYQVVTVIQSLVDTSVNIHHIILLERGGITIENNLITNAAVNSETGAGVFGAFGTAAWGRGIWINGGTVDVSIDSNALFSTRSGINLEEYQDDVRTVDGNRFAVSGTGIAGCR